MHWTELLCSFLCICIIWCMFAQTLCTFADTEFTRWAQKLCLKEQTFEIHISQTTDHLYTGCNYTHNMLTVYSAVFARQFCSEFMHLKYSIVHLRGKRCLVANYQVTSWQTTPTALPCLSLIWLTDEHHRSYSGLLTIATPPHTALHNTFKCNNFNFNRY